MSDASASPRWGPFGRLLRLAVPSLSAWRPWTARRMLALALVLPALLALQLVHWVGFLLDEVLFRGYRRIEIEEPLFVVGLPRSGTSFLQRVLALDERRTTMRLWQLVLAPSVTERRFYGALIRIDSAVGAPGRRALGWLGRRVTGWMDDVHPVSLTEPEEDFLLLLPAFACFLLVLVFPLHPQVWSLVDIDGWEAADRRRLMSFYRSCLQRHLYAERAGRGGTTTLLSKNPSFTGAVFALAEAFPGSRFACCVRDPREGVPSQLSAVDDGLRLFGTRADHPEIRDRFLGMMEHYASHAIRAGDDLPEDRWVFVRQPDLRADLLRVVEDAYVRFGWTMTTEFRERVAAVAKQSRAHRSTHSYSADALGLSGSELETRFQPFMARFDFGAVQDGSRSRTPVSQ